jgi:CHAD domain-containing protein
MDDATTQTGQTGTSDQTVQMEQIAEVQAPPAADSFAPEGRLPRYADSLKKVQELALEQLDRLMSTQPKVLRGDDANAIHDMRVATRRLQQVLDLLYPKPRPQEIRRFRRQIQRCRQILGEVRNCDVMLEIVGHPLGRKRSARREAWEALQTFIQLRRTETFARTMRKIGKINLSVVYVNLKDLLLQAKAPDQGPEHTLSGTAATAHNFAREFAHALELTWKRFEDQIARSHRDPRPEIIHEARIAAKRLRYLLEVFHKFEVPGSSDMLICLRGLQKDLGDWHDLEVLEQMMIEMLARKEFLRDHLPLAMQIQKLILRNRENKVGLEEKYFRMSRGSAEMERLKVWISYVLASPAAALVKS